MGVFVMGGALLAPSGYASKDNVVGLQMSPDYTGSPFYPDHQKVAVSSSEPVWVGGGFVETFAFGGLAPKDQSGGEDVPMPKPDRPFSLADAVAISSAALGTSSSLPLVGSFLPEFLYWPVISGSQKAMPFQMGDGGDIDNTGILAMLQRKVLKLVWLVNTDVKITDTEDFCSLEKFGLPYGFSYHGKVTNQMTDKFGYGEDNDQLHLSKNQVFAHADFLPFVCAFQTLKKAGKPTVHEASLVTLPNEWWGIQGGMKIELIAIYNDKCESFERSLPVDTQNALRSRGNFAYFPNFKTLFENGLGHKISLSKAQINLLAAQTEYFVRHNEAMFRKLLHR